MTDPRRSWILIHLLMVSALGGALLAIGAATVLAADKTVETTGALGTYNWTPESTEINAGGTVEFKNAQANLHAVTWNAGDPETPSCPGVPTTGTMNWTGTCTFAQAGTYAFHCTVHPTEMTGTITVAAIGPQPPVVTTETATAIKDTEATLNGKVNPSGQATTYWFKYGLTNAYGSETTHESAGSGSAAIAKAAAVSGLTAGTEYHFRMFAENGTGTSMGVDRTFKTGAPPTATTDPAASIGPVSATLKGTVNPKGLETKYFFNYGTDETYGQKTAETAIPVGQSNVAASKLVSGLEPETEYHFQIVAKNSAAGGEVLGADRTFTTTGGPVATTGQASEIGETTATVKGVVNPQGQTTKYFFNYGTTTAYGQKTSETSAGAGTTDVNASTQLTGLSPGTAYHFQLVAKSAGGETKGLDGTFTTESTPPPPPPPPPPGKLRSRRRQRRPPQFPLTPRSRQSPRRRRATGRRRSNSAPRSPAPASSAASTRSRSRRAARPSPLPR